MVTERENKLMDMMSKMSFYAHTLRIYREDTDNYNYAVKGIDALDAEFSKLAEEIRSELQGGDR